MEAIECPQSLGNMLKFADLFAGIGGFRIGFESNGYKCVYSSEINASCQETYWNNFGDKPAGDINHQNIFEIPDFDVLTAGFPCQPFSICGQQKGFNDARGTLFFRICEIIEIKKPSVVVLENVKNLTHHDGGNTFRVILRSLESLGYQVSYKVLNAKDFGMPQNRERVIIVGTKTRPFSFSSLRTSKPTQLKDYLCDSGEFQYLKPDEYTLISKPVLQSSGLVFCGYRNKSTRQKGVKASSKHLSGTHRQCNRIYSVEGLHPTLISQEPSGRFFIYLPNENKVRRLTLRECYRIMGFPDDFKLHPRLSECYKQIGNSVCVPMITEVARWLAVDNYIL